MPWPSFVKTFDDILRETMPLELYSVISIIHIASGGARSRNLGGHLGGKLIFWGGQDIIFKKVLLYRHRGTNILGISPPPPEGRMPQEYRPPPLGYSLPIYAMWFIQIIS